MTLGHVLHSGRFLVFFFVFFFKIHDFVRFRMWDLSVFSGVRTSEEHSNCIIILLIGLTTFIQIFTFCFCAMFSLIESFLFAVTGKHDETGAS